MSADPIIYCLERLTDYRHFERLISALLADDGYPGIDPLGGTGDGGRDAIVRIDDAGRKICFAYTVRADWRTKFQSDCKRIQELGHAPDAVVFACTATLSAADKDGAHEMVAQKFGWTLDLYDIERIRVQLAGRQRHLLAQHQSIFSPPFFPQKGGQSISASADTLLIDHVPADHALATWLSKRLSLLGYRTWCHGSAPLAGENPDDSVRELLSARAIQYLPIFSAEGLANDLLAERCAVAVAKSDFVLPCLASRSAERPKSLRLAALMPAHFEESWNTGLMQVVERLKALGIGPSLETESGRQIALRDYMPTRVTVAKPEPVYANVYPLKLPKKMYLYSIATQLDNPELLKLRQQWAFVEMGPYRLVSFMPIPSDAAEKMRVGSTAEFLWEETGFKDGKKTIDLAKELARRSLEVICAHKGLRFCEHRKVFYYPKTKAEEWNQAITHVDGRTTTVRLTGERTKGWGDRASLFHYQLAPRFRAVRDDGGLWSVVVNVYVRVTTTDGIPFEEKEIGRRRKVVTKSWWNKEWLARQLAIVQALQTADGEIALGSGSSAVVMKTDPLSWDCPVGLDVAALSGISDIGEEIAQYRTRSDEETDMSSVGNVEER